MEKNNIKKQNVYISEEENLLNWNDIQESFKKSFGKEVYDSWLQKISLIKEYNDYLILGVPTRFFRDWIVSRYLDKILEQEHSVASRDFSDKKNPLNSIKGSKKKGGEKMKKNIEGIKYLQYNDFVKVEMKTGTITSVNDHPNADKLYVITLNDGSSDRTICAGIKQSYQPEQLLGKLVVFVANLQPRPLRGITSEGMILAADDGNGIVKLVTIDGAIDNGSQIR